MAAKSRPNFWPRSKNCKCSCEAEYFIKIIYALKSKMGQISSTLVFQDDLMMARENQALKDRLILKCATFS